MSIAAPISHPFLTEEEQAVIKSTVAGINQSGRFHLDSDNLPPYVAQKIVSVLDSLAEGQDVRVPPPQTELTIAQAAKYLDLAESSIHVLLGNGALKGRREGDRFWIDRSSLLEYEENCRRVNEGLDRIARMSQEMGLYDMEPCDE